MSVQKPDTGRLGEEYAARFLEKQGYHVLAMNYRSRFGEIDIIAKNEKYIIFVEVKTRSQKSIAKPREWVDNSKQRKIIKTALLYLSTRNSRLQPRFDVMELVVNPHVPGGFEAKYLQNAFDASGIY